MTKEAGTWLGGYDIQPIIDDAAAKAVAEEREACAKLVDLEVTQGSNDPFCCDIALKNVANAIRARGK